MDKRLKIILVCVLPIALSACVFITTIALFFITLQPSGIATVQALLTGTVSNNVELKIVVMNKDKNKTLRDIYISLDGLPNDIYCDSASCGVPGVVAKVTYENLQSRQGWHGINVTFTPVVALEHGESNVFRMLLESPHIQIREIGGYIVYRGASMIGVHPQDFHSERFVARSVSLSDGCQR